MKSNHFFAVILIIITLMSQDDRLLILGKSNLFKAIIKTIRTFDNININQGKSLFKS